MDFDLNWRKISKFKNFLELPGIPGTFKLRKSVKLRKFRRISCKSSPIKVNFSHEYIFNFLKQKSWSKPRNTKSPELVRCSMTWFLLSFSARLEEIYSWNFVAFFIARYFLALITSENCRVWSPKNCFSDFMLRLHFSGKILSRIEIYCHSAGSFTVSFCKISEFIAPDHGSRESRLSDRSIIEGCDWLRKRDHERWIVVRSSKVGQQVESSSCRRVESSN